MWYNGGTGAYVKMPYGTLYCNGFVCNNRCRARGRGDAIRWRGPSKLHTTRVVQVAVDRSATSDDAPAAGVYFLRPGNLSRRDNCSYSLPVLPKMRIYSWRRRIVLHISHGLLADDQFALLDIHNRTKLRSLCGLLRRCLDLSYRGV